MVLAERAERANGVGTTAAAARFGVVFSQWRGSSSSEFGKQWRCTSGLSWGVLSVLLAGRCTSGLGRGWSIVFDGGCTSSRGRGVWIVFMAERCISGFGCGTERFNSWGTDRFNGWLMYQPHFRGWWSVYWLGDAPMALDVGLERCN